MWIYDLYGTNPTPSPPPGFEAVCARMLKVISEGPASISIQFIFPRQISSQFVVWKYGKSVPISVGNKSRSKLAKVAQK